MTRSGWVRRYLELLVAEPLEPGLTALNDLTRAHVARVPFENVSSILRRSATPPGAVPWLDLELILDNWVNERGGGVCFEITAMFELLLRDLGYQVHTVMADSSFPGSHQALVVELDRTRYLVDVGNAAPLFDPIRLDGVVHVQHAGLAYRFRPAEGEADIWCLDRLIDGTWAPFMRYHLQPASAQDREVAYQRHHTPGQSWVVDSLRILRCGRDQVCLVRDERFTRFTSAAKHVEQIQNRAAYVRIAADVFGMPDLPVGAAFDALTERIR